MTLGADQPEILSDALTAIMSSSKPKRSKKYNYISLRYITTQQQGQKQHFSN
jgi:hypothetical protein